MHFESYLCSRFEDEGRNVLNQGHIHHYVALFFCSLNAGTNHIGSECTVWSYYKWLQRTNFIQIKHEKLPPLKLGWWNLNHPAENSMSSFDEWTFPIVVWLMTIPVVQRPQHCWPLRIRAPVILIPPSDENYPQSSVMHSENLPRQFWHWYRQPTVGSNRRKSLLLAILESDLGSIHKFALSWLRTIACAIIINWQ